MQLIEMTTSEQRLNVFKVLEHNLTDILARRCFYISHKVHYPEFRGVLQEALSTIAAQGPLDHSDVIIIDRSSEAGSNFDAQQAQSILDFCATSRLPIENIVFVSQSSYLANMRKAFQEVQAQRVISWLPYHHFLHRCAEHYRDHPADEFGLDDLIETPPLFLCTNHKLRVHRRVIVEYLLASGMHKNFLLSYHANNVLGLSDRYTQVVQREFPKYYTFLADHEALEVFREKPKMELQEDVAAHNFIDGFPVQAARSSLISVVCESDFAPGFSRVTEKSLKPYLYFRPSIIWGPMGAIRLLEGFGFQHFSDVIDASYDAVANHEERLTRILAEVERLTVELADPLRRKLFIESVRETCAYNQAHLKSGLIPLLEDTFVRGLNFLTRRSNCLGTSKG